MKYTLGSIGCFFEIIVSAHRFRVHTCPTDGRRGSGFSDEIGIGRLALPICFEIVPARRPAGRDESMNHIILPMSLGYGLWQILLYLSDFCAFLSQFASACATADRR